MRSFSLGVWFIAMTGLFAAPAAAVVIDDFDEGPYSLTLANRVYGNDQTQSGLHPASTIGGTRSLLNPWAFYPGEVTPPMPTQLGVDAELGAFYALTYPGSYNYFSLEWGSDNSPLNADLAADGADRFRVRLSDEIATRDQTLYLTLQVESVVDNVSRFAQRSIGVQRFLTIPAGGVFEMPFDAFTQTPGFFENVQSVKLAASRYQGNFSIDVIETAAAPSAGDLNRDGLVDEDDLAYLHDSYHGIRTSGNVVGGFTYHTADANTDGYIDAADYTFWRDAFDAQPSTLATPEPSAVALAAIGAGLLTGLRPSRS
ncbi:hypothetical protein [Botrimarina mediterranea]|uniref:PEP-CTERM protein-sorting domain-containing protein n=1 Tax=Botrimarina mediterranea TaxID=2528022 RepID=A0A518K514_9BACT|nr:hypothetical protein [Botrimarina mediterranea]QDV72878.1 hypothetical protein Spa11_10620 [Botrimarina mediterranea]QDV77451.1 hypothetical protein K2D_10440 [Planctomycetes bacterium K2D]